VEKCVMEAYTWLLGYGDINLAETKVPQPKTCTLLHGYKEISLDVTKRKPRTCLILTTRLQNMSIK
jgi:hypothetical protein